MSESMQYGKIRLRSRVSSALKACLVYALILVAVGLAQPANAASGSTESDAKPAAEPSVKDQIMEVWNRDVFLGDWRGLRTQLHDRGIDIGLRLSQYGQGVASGGVNQNAEYGGRMDYRVNTDLRKLFGLWEGSSISMHAMSRFGRDIGADAGAFALPNTELLMPLPDDYSGSNITGLTITQALFKGRAAAFFGKLDVIDLVTGFLPMSPTDRRASGTSTASPGSLRLELNFAGSARSPHSYGVYQMGDV